MGRPGDRPCRSVVPARSAAVTGTRPRASPTRRRSAMQQFGLGDYAECALAYTLAARVALHRGDVERARDGGHAGRATAAIPDLQTSDLFGAHPARARPDLCCPRGRRWRPGGPAAGTRRSCKSDPSWACFPSRSTSSRRSWTRCAPETLAHRRSPPRSCGSCRFCPRTSRYPQIGERLYVSRNTVKSHAISIYQKLGVSSRNEAIDRLHEIGLLET